MIGLAEGIRVSLKSLARDLVCERAKGAEAEEGEELVVGVSNCWDEVGVS